MTGADLSAHLRADRPEAIRRVEGMVRDDTGAFTGLAPLEDHAAVTRR